MKEEFSFKNEILPSLKTRMLLFRYSNFFQVFNSAVIILFAIVLGVKSFQLDPTVSIFLETLDEAITVYFAVEIIVKIISDGYRRFFYDSWNVFDFVVVFFSLPFIWDTNSAAIRIFKIFRVIVVNQELKKLVNIVISSIPAILSVFILITLAIYVYAVVGNLWFSAMPNGDWSNVGIAMLTLFKVMTGDDWFSVMNNVIAQYPWAIFFFISFVVLTTYVFLNLFIAIIIEEIQKFRSLAIDKELEKKNDDLASIKDDLDLIKKLLKDKNEII